MKRSSFLTLLLGVTGLVCFALGMCLCLLPEWNTFRQGLVLGILGLLILLVTAVIRRKLAGKPPIRLSAKTVGGILLGAVGALALGVGMCLCMVWDALLWGVLVGLLGILLLLCLIPYCKGLH